MLKTRKKLLIAATSNIKILESKINHDIIMKFGSNQKYQTTLFADIDKKPKNRSLYQLFEKLFPSNS